MSAEKTVEGVNQTVVYTMDKAEQLLRQMASLIGTTVDHLLQVYARQAVVSGMTNIVITVVSLVLFLIFGIKQLNCFQKSDFKDNANGFYGVVLCFLAFGFFIVFSCNISDWIGQVCNGEYWAIQSIMANMRGYLQ